MLADPQSVTVNAVAISLPTVRRGVDTSTYRAADGNTELVLSHSYGKRVRRVVRLIFRKLRRIH